MATTLASLLTNVYAITNRPELVTETTLAVKYATLKAHNLDFFPRDISESSFAFPTAEYIQNLDYSALLSRYKSLAYLRKMDSVTGENGDYLDVILPTQALDNYKQIRKNVVYQAGAYLQIRTDSPWQYFTIGAYLLPDITDATYSSWIADTVPSAIVYEASRVIFKTIGKDEEAATYNQLTGEAFAEVIRVGILAQGY